MPALFAEFVSKGLEVLDDAGASPKFFKLMSATWQANVGEHLFENPDTADPKSFQTEAEMLADSFFFNVMGQDDATGKIKLSGIDGDQIDLGWEQPMPSRSSGRTSKVCCVNLARQWVEDTLTCLLGKVCWERKSW